MDKQLSNEAVVSMQQRNKDSAYKSNEIKDAFDNAVDCAEAEGRKSKFSRFITAIRNKSHNVYVGFRDNSKSIGASLSLAYAAYQTQRLRDKTSARDNKIAKYDDYLATHMPSNNMVKTDDSVSVDESTTATKTEDVVKVVEDVAVVTDVSKSTESKQPVTDVKDVDTKSTVTETTSKDEIVSDEIETKSSPEPQLSKSDILMQKRTVLEEAYKNGMVNVISALKDYLNEFDEKSASIEQLEDVTLNVQQAGKHMDNLSKPMRELPDINYEQNTEASIDYSDGYQGA